MKFLKGSIFASMIILIGASLFSCGDDDESIFNPIDTTQTFDVTIENDATSDASVTIQASNFAGMSTVSALLDFESSDNMRRIYITREFEGVEEPFDLRTELGLTGQEVKEDGSLDLPNSLSNDIEIAFNLPIPDAGTGTVIYRFWATSGRGSFRDPSKRLLVGVNTVNIVFDSSNPNPDLLSFTNIELFAPTEDLISQSFVSSVDGTTFQLTNLDNAALWDIGYNAQNDVPSLSSPSASPQRFPDPDGGTGTISLLELINSNRDSGVDELTMTDLNATYFAELTGTVDFDGFEANSDLDNLDVDTNDDQFFNLSESATGPYYIAFLDVQGHKGVIEVTDLVDGDGDGNFFEANDKVIFNIKVQQ